MFKHGKTETGLLYREISRLEKENDKLRSENERLRSNFKDIENCRNLYNDLIIEVNGIKENYKKKEDKFNRITGCYEQELDKLLSKVK